jgi:regulator of nucleoside diphosphate kinase
LKEQINMQSCNRSGAPNLPEILIPSSDYDRLVEVADRAEHTTPQVAEYLGRELGRAQIVPDLEFDPGAARMGSLVTYCDDQNGNRRTVTLVWPQEGDVGRNRISVLTSVGAALLGLRAGQSIDWPAPLGGATTLTVVEVLNAGGPPAQAPISA